MMGSFNNNDKVALDGDGNFVKARRGDYVVGVIDNDPSHEGFAKVRVLENHIGIIMGGMSVQIAPNYNDKRVGSSRPLPEPKPAVSSSRGWVGTPVVHVKPLSMVMGPIEDRSGPTTKVVVANGEFATVMSVNPVLGMSSGGEPVAGTMSTLRLRLERNDAFVKLVIASSVHLR